FLQCVFNFLAFLYFLAHLLRLVKKVFSRKSLEMPRVRLSTPPPPPLFSTSMEVIQHSQQNLDFKILVGVPVDPLKESLSQNHTPRSVIHKNFNLPFNHNILSFNNCEHIFESYFLNSSYTCWVSGN